MKWRSQRTDLRSVFRPARRKLWLAYQYFGMRPLWCNFSIFVQLIFCIAYSDAFQNLYFPTQLLAGQNMKLPQTWVIKPTTVSFHHSSPVKHFFLWWVWAWIKFHFSHKNQLFTFSMWYGRMQLKIVQFYPHGSGKQTSHPCENIEKICGPGFPKSAVQKILYPTLSEERSNWISTFYSGVDTNAFITSPILFSSKFPSLISSTRRLDVTFSSLLHTFSQLLHPYHHLYSTVYPPLLTRAPHHFSPPNTHSPFFDFKKLSPRSFDFNSLKITPLRANSKIFQRSHSLRRAGFNTDLISVL